MSHVSYIVFTPMLSVERTNGLVQLLLPVLHVGRVTPFNPVMRNLQILVIMREVAMSAHKASKMYLGIVLPEH